MKPAASFFAVMCTVPRALLVRSCPVCVFLMWFNAVGKLVIENTRRHRGQQWAIMALLYASRMVYRLFSNSMEQVKGDSMVTGISWSVRIHASSAGVAIASSSLDVLHSLEQSS